MFSCLGMTVQFNCNFIMIIIYNFCLSHSFDNLSRILCGAFRIVTLLNIHYF